VVQAPRVSAAARPGVPDPQPRAVAERYLLGRASCTTRPA